MVEKVRMIPNNGGMETWGEGKRFLAEKLAK